jgi:hypothetical protein
MTVAQLVDQAKVHKSTAETTPSAKMIEIINVYGRIYIWPNSSKKLDLASQKAVDAVFVRASTDNCLEVLEPNSLAHIYSFHQSLVSMLDTIADKNLVIMVNYDPKLLTTFALLLGGHMIISQGMSIEDVAECFSPISVMFSNFTDGNGTDLAVEDCWRAIHRATVLGWVTFNLPQEDDRDEAINMDEYLHYDDSPNGAMHLVDPSRMLLFREPADLAAGVAWKDEGGHRRFGAEHYAWLFEDFGVRLVVRCGGGAWDSAALRASGIAVEDLCVAEDGAGMLSVVDRFLTLARVAPGCIAVQCGGGGRMATNDDAGEDGDAGARLLVAAHLIRSRGFGAADALAWVCIAHPVRARPAPELVLMRGAGSDAVH